MRMKQYIITVQKTMRKSFNNCKQSVIMKCDKQSQVYIHIDCNWAHKIGSREHRR